MKYTFTDQKRVLRREIQRRKKTLDKSVEFGRVTREQGMFEISCLEDTLITISDLDTLLRDRVSANEGVIIYAEL